MTKAQTGSRMLDVIVIAAVSLALLAANLYSFNRMAKADCPNGMGTYTQSYSVRGLPLTYWKTGGDKNLSNCGFDMGWSDSKSTFLYQSLVVDLGVAGAVLIATHVALDYRRQRR